MKRKLYITPYSLGSLKLTDVEFLDLAKQLGFDGVESVNVLTPEYADDAEERGLEIAHARLPYEPDFTVDEKYIEFIKAKGINEVSMINTTIAQEMRTFFQTLMNEPDSDFRYKGLPGAFGSYESAMRAAQIGQKEARIAAEYGLKAFYHNHTHEFRKDNGDYVIDTYLKNTPDNIVLQLDVGWALCAGIDMIEWMKQWPGRICSLHVKPCNWALDPEALGMTYPLPPHDQGITRDHMKANQAYADSPQGPMALNIVSWQEIFATAESLGCKTFIHERERIYIANDILTCVKEDYRHLRHCLDAMEASE